MTTTIIAVANNKGGTGKTKTAIHLARSLYRLGREVVLFDLDGQANATDALMLTTATNRPSPSMAGLLAGRCTLQEAMLYVPHCAGAFRIVPSDGDLDDVADDLVTKPLGVLKLKNVIEQGAGYLGDIVVIDCPPNVGVLTFAALIAADYVIIPTKPEPWALNGVRRVQEKVAEVRESLGRGPVVLGSIATMVRDTNEHRAGLALLGGVRMPELLGSVPQRGGIDAEDRLADAYKPIAEAVMKRIGRAQ